MIELKDKRKYNQKTIVDDNGKTKVRIFTGPVHYFNKLKLGDGVEGWRDTDSTLVWDEKRRGWTFEYHNYQPFIPEYADDWFIYRDLYQGKDQSFAFKPRTAAHVLGQLQGNDVVYPDAFSPGIDLVIHFTRNTMQKLVRIRQGFYPAVDTDFDFIMKFPDGVGVYEKDTATNSMAVFDTLSAKTLGLRSEIYIGNEKNDGEEWFTKIRPVKIWDSGVVGTNFRSQIIPAAIAVVGGATILRKRVPASFFASATGDVFTDTTVTYTTTDDTFYGSSFSPGPNDTSATLGFGGWGDNYYVYLKFDLASAPLAAQASSAVLNIYTAAGSVNDAVIQCRKVIQTWAGSTLTRTNAPTEDPTNRGSLSTTVGAGWKTATITTLYQEWRNGTSASEGVKLHPTVTSNQNNGNFDSLESSNDPYLEITLAYELEQEGFRWRNDDGSETTATFITSQDSNISRQKNVNTRLRVIVNATGNPPSKGYRLEVRKAGTSDPWKIVE